MGLLHLFSPYCLCCRSQRCRQCEHNLSKPEYNPTSIKFKIQLAAFYHVPEVIIFQLGREPLRPGQDTTFVLKVTNPSGHPTSFQLLSLEDQEEADNNVTAAAVTTAEGIVDEDTNKNMSVSTVMKQLSLVKASNSHKVKVNAAFLAVKGGSSRTYLPPRDDTVGHISRDILPRFTFSE